VCRGDARLWDREFPITELLEEELRTQWLLKHFHPDGLKCPRCGSREEEARTFRRTRRSGLVVYRCRQCEQTYSLYTDTVFEHRHLTPMQVVLLVRGVCKGEPTVTLARELGLTRSTVHEIRHALQANAHALQPVTPLPDQQTETDEMFENAGEKR
jgi:transposase-like protein